MKRTFRETTWRKNPQFRALCRAFQDCSSEQEIANFLRDIGTLSELQAWSERLEVAKQLDRGLPYREISENTGASTTTVTRVAYFLTSGMKGYKTIFSRMHHSHPKISRGERMVSMA